MVALARFLRPFYPGEWDGMIGLITGQGKFPDPFYLLSYSPDPRILSVVFTLFFPFRLYCARAWSTGRVLLAKSPVVESLPVTAIRELVR